MVEETDTTKRDVDESSAHDAPPQPHATVGSVPSAVSSTLDTDIAHILEETKLPERTEFRTQGDIPKPVPHVEAPDPQPKPAPDVVQKPPEDHLSAIRTLRADVQEAIHDEHISLTSILSMEQERSRLKRTNIESASPGDTQRKRRTLGMLFATLLLFVLGAGAIFGVVMILQQQGSAADVPNTGSSLVFAEHSVALPLDNESPQTLKAEIGQALGQQNGALGSILQIVPILSATSSNGAAERPATLDEFLQAIGVQAPPDLIRAVGSQFFFGIHAAGKNSAVFIVPVVSYDRAFAGMLSWEPTIDQDLTPIFPQLSPYTIGTNGLPTARTFKDLVMQNYDTRALEDDTGATVLYYTFPTQAYLIISQNQATLTEVLSRMQARREI